MLHSEEPRRPIELSESLNDKTFIEEREQDEFMATLKDQFFEDNTLAMKGASEIGKLLRDNTYPKMDRCFLHLKAKSESFGKKKQISAHAAQILLIKMENLFKMNNSLNLAWAFRNIQVSEGLKKTI